MAKRFNNPKIPNSTTITSAAPRATRPSSIAQHKAKTSEAPLNLFYVVLVWAYAWFAFIPHLKAWDTNATHFMLLSLFNLAIYSYMFTTDTFKHNRFFRWVFFRNPAGFSYGLYVLIMFLSLTKIINFGEAIITTSKYFTTFTTAMILTMLISLDKRYLNHLAIAMTTVLIWDIIVMMKYLNQYVSGKIGSIYEFKSNYSNKNIYSSGMFVKIPFAVWLYLRDNSIWRKIGLAVSFGGFFSIWVLSTRTTYLGVFVLFFILALYVVFVQLRSSRTNWRRFFATMIPLVLTALLSVGVYNLTRHFLYPKNNNDNSMGYKDGIQSRLSSVDINNSGNDGSIALRFTSWKNSYKLFKDEPILGAGVGNWKIKILKYENLHNGSFTYMYKAHNDFVETFTELGVFGGLTYVGIFLLIGYNFFRKYEPETDEENPEKQFNNSALFLGLFGIAAYSVDAFFNFPLDRPPMQILFGAFVGVSIAYSMLEFKKQFEQAEHAHKLPEYLNYGKYITYIIIFIAAGAAWILWINYQSSKIQWIIAQDSAQPKQQLTGEQLRVKIPRIPDITVVEEPMAVVKGRYFINVNKFDEALKELVGDKSSPYDGRVEYLSAFCYFRINKIDSAIYYCKKSMAVKPKFWGPVALLSDIYVTRGDLASATRETEGFLKKNKEERAAWQNIASLYERQGNRLKAATMIDSATKYTGVDSSLLRIKDLLLQRGNSKVSINPNASVYQLAANAFNSKKYGEAIQYFTAFLATEQNPQNILRAREFRGYSYFNTKQYNRALADFEYVKKFVSTNVNVNAMHMMCLNSLGKGQKTGGFDLSKLNNNNPQTQLTPEMEKALRKAQAEQAQKEFEEQQKAAEERKNAIPLMKIEELKKEQQKRVQELEKQKGGN